MDSEKNPVKDALYSEIECLGEYNVRKQLARGNCSDVISELINGVLQKDGMRQKTADVQTALLHFALHAATIPSQRKVECDGVYIDVVVPDLRTLRQNPNDALLLCIPTLENVIREESINTIQPVRENVWFVAEAPLGVRTYSLHDGTFSGLVDDVRQFASQKGFRLRFSGV